MYDRYSAELRSLGVDMREASSFSRTLAADLATGNGLLHVDMHNGTVL